MTNTPAISQTDRDAYAAEIEAHLDCLLKTILNVAGEMADATAPAEDGVDAYNAAFKAAYNSLTRQVTRSLRETMVR